MAEALRSIQPKSKALPARAAIVLLIGVAVGCGPAPLDPAALELLHSGIEAYEQDDNWAVIERMDAFLAGYARSRQADEAYYYRALAHHRLQNYDRAERDFTAALDRTRRQDLRVLAQLALGDLAHDAGRLKAAEEMYRQSLADTGHDKAPADRGLYRLGAVLQRQGRWREADVYFNELIGNFPAANELVQQATRRVHASGWTVQVGAFIGRDRANRLAGKLRADGHDAFVWPARLNGRLEYLVRVGRYATYGETLRTLSGIQSRQSDAFMTVTH
ncbi:MAG: SPOR domain-containing protein [Planctomycetota bacterium]|jgi:tetratricopeptide (TPR) repeat protein